MISKISNELHGIVFLLWGNFAKKKACLINSDKHCIITASHPSPLARGFVGSGVFKKANEALIRFNKEPMDWSLE